LNARVDGWDTIAFRTLYQESDAWQLLGTSGSK